MMGRSAMQQQMGFLHVGASCLIFLVILASLLGFASVRGEKPPEARFVQRPPTT